MQTLRDLLDRNARQFPQREAFVCGERRLTHAGLRERALRLADALHRLGLRRQDRFAVLAMNCLEYYEAYAAAEAAGFILVPINFRLAAPEIVHVLRDAGVKVLLFEAQFAEAVARARQDYRELVGTACFGGAATAGELAYEALLETADPAGPPLRPAADDYGVLWYTSGTTGKPKGVAWTQQRLLGTARMNSHQAELNGSSRLLQVSPAFHIGGRGYVLGTLYLGGCVVVHKAFDPLAMLETIQRERVTHTFMVAAMVQAVLAVPTVRSFDLSSLRMVFSAAAPIPVPLLKQAMELMGPVFSIQYGCTELGSITTLPRHEVTASGTEKQLRRIGSVGVPWTEIQVRLVDDAGNECPVGTPGEIIVKSPTQLEGYWNNEPATLEAIRDGWYHTGDVGVFDDEGYLYIVDRKKDMIISGGENVYSREVEEAIASHPEVADCAVIGVPHPKWVEAVMAVVVRRAGSTLTEAQLIAHCRERIAGYKCPKSVEFVAEVPRMATGKIDKPALRRNYRPG